MKNLILIITATLLTVNLFSQVDNKEDEQHSKQYKIAVMTNPVFTAFGGYNVSVEYGLTHKQTLEVGGKLSFRNAIDGSKRTYSKMIHSRVKFDILPDDKSLSGVYLAPGVNFGQFNYNSRSKVFAGAITSDVGIQFGLKNIILDAYAGAGLEANNSSNRDFYAFSFAYNPKPIFLRMGLKVGVRF